MSEAESTWVKSWLASVSIVLMLQAGTLIWFLAKVDSRVGNLEQVQEKVETLWEHHIKTSR
jgi:hypothetical protein